MFDEEDYIKIFNNLIDTYNSICNENSYIGDDSREKSIRNLSEEFIKINDLENNNLNIVKKISFIIEISNNIAHNEEREIKNVLPKITRNKILEPIMVMFTNSANEKHKYPVDFNLPFDKRKKEPLSIQIAERILKNNNLNVEEN